MLFKQNVLASYNFMCFVLISCDVFIPMLMLVIILGKIENRNSNCYVKATCYSQEYVCFNSGLMDTRDMPYVIKKNFIILEKNV